MKILCLILLCHASLQLQCDKTDITAHIGAELVLFCTYDAKQYMYNIKYWCRGDDRRTCEILVNSDFGRIKNTHRSHILDAGRRGLFVKVTDLQFDDAGVYWVGIDKAFSDVMTSVKVVITEVPVSKPRLWPLSSLADRPTCWGQPLTVRCGCTEGTGVRYAWYRGGILLYRSSDLNLHCGTAQEDGHYYCIASNDVSSQRSHIISVRVLVPADHSCIYAVNIAGQPVYDCDDRMSTRQTTVNVPQTTVNVPQTTVNVPQTTVTVPQTTVNFPQTTVDVNSDIRNRSLLINQTDQDPFFSRTWTGVPFWYELLRWSAFASLLIFLCVVLRCTKTRPKRAKRRRRVRVR